MTNRIVTLTVALDHPYRDDDVQPIISAIEHIKGVLAVTTEPVTGDYYAAQKAAEAEIRNRIWSTLHHTDGPHV